MVVIRLARSGAKGKAFFHVVAADSRHAPDGRFIEKLGYHNPHARPHETSLSLSMERIHHWKACGAQVSDTVKALVKRYEREQASASNNASAA